MRYAVALALGVVAIASAVVLGARARRWNEELAIESPFADVEMRVADPRTPPLADRVVLVVIDGLGADEAKLPYLDELRARGVAAVATVPYPTVSRPNYVTILTGVPPRDSGVRANRVLAPVTVDSVMNRVRAHALHAVTVSDYGSFASLFPAHASTTSAASTRSRRSAARACNRSSCRSASSIARRRCRRATRSSAS